ncbi:CoA pyrophosphatase [Geobacter sp. DSM 9736]|uniref:NUDIX hydrolase n=1 Tax=Geobacter sp. DSM 9736 TaxID=1277350 RepID=UPI000B5053FE|nr:NUDIX domain-containing protein [Geobacter sp. DSM 9736]
MLSIDKIKTRLAAHAPAVLPVDDRVRAAVALVLRCTERGPEVLFIERALRTGDPWSGDIGLPGGKVEPSDPDGRAAAEREAVEELGLDLGPATYLGFLGEIAGATLPVRVGCYVYLLEEVTELDPGDEVTDAFWVALTDLLDPARHGSVSITFQGESLPRPSIRLPQTGKPPLWGLTYRLIVELIQLLEPELQFPKQIRPTIMA